MSERQREQRSTDEAVPAAFSQPSSDSSRRLLFKRAGLVTLAGTALLAACGDDSSGARPGRSTQPSSAPSASDSPSAAESSKAPEGTKAPEGSKAPEGTKVAKADVPDGGGVVLPEKYVVTQPASNEFKAFTSICTHQGCTVASVTDKEIVCDCHLSRFSINDGSVVSGPAPAPLAEKKVTVSGSDLYVSG